MVRRPQLQFGLRSGTIRRPELQFGLRSGDVPSLVAHRSIATLAGLAALAAACAPVGMSMQRPAGGCRHADTPQVRWVTPSDPDERRRLQAWCEAVGPPAGIAGEAPPPDDGRPLLLVSWNMAVGAGRLEQLLAYVRRAHQRDAPAHLVLLLQEAFRAGDVPATCAGHVRRARRLGSRIPDRRDLISTARALGLNAVYVPSMRNGRDCREAPFEDRGNAIVSTLPLDDVTAIELPLARQRRVAVAATIRHRGRRITVVSTHFDALSRHRRQAQALRLARDLLAWDGPVIIGGDFNAGPADRGLGALARHFPQIDCAPGATHTSGWRPDRLFARHLPGLVSCHIGAERAGSDHHPIIAWVG
jgi:endonuclease/exonuclease/phosphatase family metal-dependent hydrolase